VRESERPQDEPSSPRALLSSPLTQDGALVGTPAYMSPEQYSGGVVDGRSDQFSFCAALYEALYKELPFQGADLAELSSNVVHGRLRPVQAGCQAPDQVEQALRRGLSTDPEQRFPSMAELLAALSPEVQHDPSGSPVARRLFTGSVAVLITLIALGVNLAQHNGGMTPLAYLAAAGALFAGSAIAATVLRRALRQNSFHRGLVRLVLIVSAHVFLLRVAAVSLHMQLTQVAVFDMLAVTAMMAVVSWQYLPILWPAFFAGGLSTLAVALRPDLTWTLLPLTYHLVGIAVLLAWNRAARRIGPRPGTMNGGATSSGPSASRPSGSRSDSKRQPVSRHVS
jgi:serine/threonine-protein kinase